MISKIFSLRNYIMKQLMKTTDEGIMQIPDKGKVDFGEMIIKEDLFKKGIDPKTITSETQLDTILNTPNVAPTPKKSGEVINVDFDKGRWKDIDPEDFAQGGIAGMLGERTNYSDGGNGEDDSMVGISMSIEERWERIKKLLKQMEDIKSGKTTDPNPEDKATGGRIGTGLNYLLGEDDQNMRVPYGEGSTTQDDFNQYLKDRSQRDKEERRKKFEKDFEDWKKWKETEGGTVNWAAEGGRIGYAAGGMGRRAFLKLMAALGATGVAAKSGLATLFKGGAKKSLTSVPIGNAAGMPAWFKPLVNKVIKQGDDITKKAATSERQIVHKDVLPDGDEVTVTQHLDNGNVDVSVAGKDNPWLSKTGHGEQPYNISYIKGETIIVKNKKPIKVKDKMETDEGYTYQTGPDRTDVDIDFDFVNFTEKTTKHDTSVLNSYAKGKKIKSTKKMQPLEDMSPEGDWDDSLDFASGGRVPLGKGGIAGMLGE